MALCAGVEPLAVQPPLRARVDESVDYQRLEHLQPRCVALHPRKPRPPEAVEFELLPQLQRQPARAPLPRPAQAQFAQAHANGVDVVNGHGASGEQRHLAPRAGILQLDGLAPRLALARVDLPEVQHLTLHHATIGKATILHHAPVLVALTVLHASIASQEHATSVGTHPTPAKGQGLHHKRFPPSPLYASDTCVKNRAEISKNQQRVEKDGLVATSEWVSSTIPPPSRVRVDGIEKS